MSTINSLWDIVNHIPQGMGETTRRECREAETDIRVESSRNTITNDEFDELMQAVSDIYFYADRMW